MEFDWGDRSNSEIQWAAFYSDCEHEIKTVIEGERITLTYNLYVTEPVGLGNNPYNGIIQPHFFPLYASLRRFAAMEKFKEGGMHFDRPRTILRHLPFTDDHQEKYLGYTAPILTRIARKWQLFSFPKD